MTNETTHRNETIEISGNTYPYAARIRAMGLDWDLVVKQVTASK